MKAPPANDFFIGWIGFVKVEWTIWVEHQVTPLPAFYWSVGFERSSWPSSSLNNGFLIFTHQPHPQQRFIKIIYFDGNQNKYIWWNTAQICKGALPLCTPNNQPWLILGSMRWRLRLLMPLRSGGYPAYWSVKHKALTRPYGAYSASRGGTPQGTPRLSAWQPIQPISLHRPTFAPHHAIQFKQTDPHKQKRLPICSLNFYSLDESWALFCVAPHILLNPGRSHKSIIAATTRNGGNNALQKEGNNKDSS